MSRDRRMAPPARFAIVRFRDLTGALAFVLALGATAAGAAVQPPGAGQTQLQAQIGAPAAPSLQTAPRTKPAGTKVAAGPKSESKPAWAELDRAQQQALAPLAGSWNTLTEAHKRKWLALSQNYPQLPPAEQARVHSRMAEWAALSPQQRTQARLNFAETKKVPLEDRKAAWEAYQSLPPEEKRRLAAGATAAKPPPPPTAAAVQPVPQQKLARVPRPKVNGPRIAAAPDKVDHNTLLPQPGAAAGP
jgi:hypothetical protein